MSRRLDGPPSGVDAAAPTGDSRTLVRGPRPPRRAGGLRFAAPVSLLLHLGLLAGLIFWAEHRGRTKLALSPLDQGVKVVLMLEEHKGVRSPAQPVPPQPLHPPRPPASSPAPAPTTPAPPKAEPAPARTPQAKPSEVQPPLPAPPLPAPPLPPPPHPAPPEHAPARPVPRSAAPPAAKPSPVVPRPAPPSAAPPAPQPAPELNLGNPNDDETNALVKGDAVVPAKADDRYHNREPDYPKSAVLRGEQGVVQLLIHVGPDGRAQDVEVARSSGYAALDRAARQAVMTWHFLPALKHGEAVPAEMPLRVVFHLK